jgi:hypothetical protein
MNFLETLRAHKGGLIRLKGGLFWYGGRGWDGVHDRICLLMDSARTPTGGALWFTGGAGPARTPSAETAAETAAACLLIDGRPHWVWIAPADVELL